MARSANSRRGRTGVSSKAGGTHHDRPRERRPQMPHLTFIKEDSVSLPSYVPYGSGQDLHRKRVCGSPVSVPTSKSRPIHAELPG